MAELQKTELTSYLREVFRLEHKKQEILTECDKIENEINQIKNKSYAIKPSLAHYNPPEKPEKIKKGSLGVATLVFFVVLFGGAFFVDYILEPLFPNVINNAVNGLIILFIVAVLMGVICGIGFKPWYNKKSKSEYNKEMKEYNQNVQQAEKEYNDNMLGWKKKCEMVDIENARRESKRTYKRTVKRQFENIVQKIDSSLNKLYSYDVIHKIYCNYEAVGYLLLYFETGRVDTLKEAINRYEADKFKGVLLGVLNEISFNQKITYSAIRENNMLLHETVSNMEKIAYQNEKIADYQKLTVENSKNMLASIQSIDYKQTIDMLERHSSH